MSYTLPFLKEGYPHESINDDIIKETDSSREK